jgi:hypothetical protein
VIDVAIGIEESEVVGGVDTRDQPAVSIAEEDHVVVGGRVTLAHLHSSEFVDAVVEQRHAQHAEERVVVRPQRLLHADDSPPQRLRQAGVGLTVREVAPQRVSALTLK